MTEQEAHETYTWTKEIFWATIGRLHCDGLRDNELYEHPCYVKAKKARRAAFDAWLNARQKAAEEKP